jgi:hypothetical protein
MPSSGVESEEAAVERGHPRRSADVRACAHAFESYKIANYKFVFMYVYLKITSHNIFILKRAKGL